MNQRFVRFTAPFATLLAVVTAGYAGGWAIITLNRLPDYAIAGQTLSLTFEVRQHGQTLISGLKPGVRATTATGLKARSVDIQPGRKGEYTATLLLPQPGEWTITINSGFNTSMTTLPVLKVISADSPLPIAFAPATRGARLFAAKGCVGCHRHAEVNPERSSDPTFDLTSKRFPSDYLKNLLADPSIKPAGMPNLKLQQDEIDALAAFINKSSQKSLPVRANP